MICRNARNHDADFNGDRFVMDPCDECDNTGHTLCECGDAATEEREGGERVCGAADCDARAAAV